MPPGCWFTFFRNRGLYNPVANLPERRFGFLKSGRVDPAPTGEEGIPSFDRSRNGRKAGFFRPAKAGKMPQQKANFPAVRKCSGFSPAGRMQAKPAQGQPARL